MHMKIQVGYDTEGNIVTVAVPSGDFRDLSLDSEPGQYADEFEADHGKDAEPHEVLADVMRNYRVERATATDDLPHRARLVRKR
jgi:hypothetical protein